MGAGGREAGRVKRGGGGKKKAKGVGEGRGGGGGGMERRETTQFNHGA